MASGPQEWTSYYPTKEAKGPSTLPIYANGDPGSLYRHPWLRSWLTG